MIETPPDHEPVSLQVMRVVIRYRKGWRSLRNYIRIVEEVRKVNILKASPGPVRTRLLVTLGDLKAYAPEIVPPHLREEGAVLNSRVSLREARDLVAHRREFMEEVARDVVEDRCGKRLDRLSARLRVVEKNQGRHEKALNQLNLFG